MVVSRIKSALVLFICIVGVYHFAVEAESPLQVVQRVRGKYPNLPNNRAITNQALKEIVADPSVRGSLYRKTSGNNCLGYSCDKICFANNTEMYDVFIDWEGTARASWQRVTNFDPKNCLAVNPTPPPTCPQCPTCPTCPTCPPNSDCAFEKAEVVRLSQALAELQNKYNNVTCTTPSYFGWHSPCTVVK